MSAQGVAPLAIVLVVSMAENGVIGRANAIPWRLKSDLRHFRSVTWGKPLLMGRRTFESIKRALPGRTSIVLSANAGFYARGAVVAANLNRALAVARGDALRRGAGSIAVIGGAEIFRQTLPLAEEIFLTIVHARPEGDTLFPPWEPALWREIEHREEPAGAGDDAAFSLIRLKRREAPIP